MNNQTFNIFASDSYVDLLFSIPLNEILVKEASMAGCLEVADRRSGKKRVLCTMNMYMTDA